MTRPDVACFCLHLGIHEALTAHGPTRAAMLAAFHATHSGSGHLPEVPARTWHGQQAQLAERIRQLQREAGIR